MQKMPQARRSGLIIQELDSEILIYDQDTNKAHCLNHTAAKVWKYCDGETTLADACSALSRDLETPVDEKLVWYAVDQFSKDNLLEKEIEPPAFIIAGMNRRQMVRTLGLGSNRRSAPGDFYCCPDACASRNLSPARPAVRYQCPMLQWSVQRWNLRVSL